MDTLYILVLLCVLYFLFGEYIPKVAQTVDLDQVELRTQYPSLVACIDVFPDDQKIYKDLCYQYLKAFMSAYKKSFDPGENPAVLVEDMKTLARKVEGHQREMIFRLPNDLKLQKRLEASTELLCLYLERFQKDVGERWANVSFPKTHKNPTLQGYTKASY